MIEPPADKQITLPLWCIRFCAWCWKGRTFLFGTIIFGMLLNLLAALLTIDPQTPLPALEWVKSNLFAVLLSFVVLLLFTLLCGLVARLSVPLSARELCIRYLEQVMRDTELVTLRGIPAGLIAESVKLADIYIPPSFYTNRARVDFPVSDEDLERYRLALKQGMSAPDLERVVVEAEKNWQHIVKSGGRVGLQRVWRHLSTYRAVVIQGYPGMGKSTLMERLALYMAACGLRYADAEMPEREALTPILIPVLLRLNRYARALAGNAALSLPDYLCQIIDDAQWPGLVACMQQQLLDGKCLVMLDGLDEVSDPLLREQVQEKIRALVGGQYNRNRFTITSRVAGYNQAAFPAYAHFTLAELTSEEIDYFLPRWCRANLQREQALRAGVMQYALLEREVEQRVRELEAAMKDNQGVRTLAQNPLLLTLLLVMQQNSVILPRQRVELYTTVTKTLLESRQIAKGLEAASEFQAIERLGPLAFQMQEENSEFVHQKIVDEVLVQTIRQREGGDEERIAAEAARFLQRMRERGGLFVSRVGDYFGFMHRTFQEYFAARYILNNMKADQQRWITILVKRASRQDAFWREPFLLAVAYQSNENERVAGEILRALLAEPVHSFEQDVFVVALAASALLEARPLTIDVDVQKRACWPVMGRHSVSVISKCARESKNFYSTGSPVCRKKPIANRCSTPSHRRSKTHSRSPTSVMS